MKNTLILYSVNTKLACLINQNYYDDKHYVWCSPYFDCRKLDVFKRNNPPSSNPYDIYMSYLNDVKRCDAHSKIVQGNREGIIKGAKMKYEKGLISSEKKNEIVDLVAGAPINYFSPLLYVIPFYHVSAITREVSIKLRANSFSKEYIIEELPGHYFDIIEFEGEVK